jgi:hypothetical protein
VKKSPRRKTRPSYNSSFSGESRAKKYWISEDIGENNFDSLGSEYVPGEEEEDEEEYVET